MKADLDLLHRFEQQLIPTHLDRSLIPVKVLGYGEISSIFQIDNNEHLVYKRLPFFRTIESAKEYQNLYERYCQALTQIGINLPEDDVARIEIPGRLISLYFLQQRYSPEHFCHTLIHHLEKPQLIRMIESITNTLKSIWTFNREQDGQLETAIDAQLSNWVWLKDGNERKLVLVDTSTPFLRINGEEQLDVELLLKAVPVFIRWAIRRLNLDDVIGKYYDHRKVLIDVLGNLHKEQKPELIPLFLEAINDLLPADTDPILREEVDSYYKEDKMIWTLFSALRRADRFITTKVLRKRYEFILPGKVKR